jgi:hypothetical protein
MAGNSRARPPMAGSSQARKLGLKAGQRVALCGAPDGWRLTDPPAGLVTPDAPLARGTDRTDGTADGTDGTPDRTDWDGTPDVVIAFFRAADEIAGLLPALARSVFPDGAVWALWPRRAAGHVSDITDNTVRGYALDLGLVDVKVAAVDEDWSGLRLVWRTANR